MLVRTEAEAQNAFAYLGARDTITMDTETTGKDWRIDQVVSVQLLAGDQSYYFPFRHAEGPNLPISYLHRLYAEQLPPERLQIGFNYGFDRKVSHKDGMMRPQRIMDPLLAAHQMNENEDSFKLKDLATKYVDPTASASEQALLDLLVERFGGVVKDAKGGLWRLSAEQVTAYGEDDVWLTRRLMEFYIPHLHEWSVWEVFQEVCDFQLLLSDIELRGMPLSMPRLLKLGEEAAPKAAALRAQIAKQAQLDLNDPDFPGNPRSHPQMHFWLGQVLNVPNTSKDVLKLADDERAQMLLDFRVWDKLMGSFVEPYQRKVQADGRIRCNLYITTPGVRDKQEIHGTVSDRVSSTDPNMQQVPPAVRGAFEAPDGMEFLEADFSQAELRAAAHYYEARFQDTSLGDVLRAGEDMHAVVAESFGIPRKVAKTRNFAIQYGAGATTLARKNKTSKADEQRYLNHYNKTYPGVKRLREYCEREATQRGYIRLWTGRTRRYNTPRAKTFSASNNLIQGAIAQMLRRTMLRVNREVPEAIMVLTVHDSILFLIPKGRLDLADRIRRIMQDQPWCTIAMIVDLKHGPTWGDMEDLPRSVDGIPEVCLVGVDLAKNRFREAL
jgi:DNA polymerase-1